MGRAEGELGRRGTQAEGSSLKYRRGPARDVRDRAEMWWIGVEFSCQHNFTSVKSGTWRERMSCWKGSQLLVEAVVLGPKRSK